MELQKCVFEGKSRFVLQKAGFIREFDRRVGWPAAEVVSPVLIGFVFRGAKPIEAFLFKQLVGSFCCFFVFLAGAGNCVGFVL